MDLARPGSPVAQVLAACGLGKGRPTLGDEHATLADEAELALLDHLAHAPGVDRQSIGDGYLMRTGLFDNSRNVIVSNRLPVFLSVDEVIGRLSGVPARWHTGDMSDSPSLRLALEREIGRAHV